MELKKKKEKKGKRELKGEMIQIFGENGNGGIPFTPSENNYIQKCQLQKTTAPNDTPNTQI